MSNNTIMILGDSTSMSLGVEHHMFPFLIAEREEWPESTEIVNCSQPGITSADACAFFFRHRKDFRALRAVIIHLGTCDATSSEISKGRYTFSRQVKNRLIEKVGLRKERSRLKNRLLPFEWNQDYDPAIERPEKVDDYEFNLTRIIRACQRSSIPVILIKPKSNPLCPPGIGKGNFIFYNYLGMKDKISDRLSLSDARFQQAQKFYEEGDFSTAMKTYREILLNVGPLSTHPEYSLMVVNNYAVAVAEQGQWEEAYFLLKLLLKESSVRKEIVLYNLAQLSKKKGDLSGYSKYLQESYENDYSLYRVRSSYLQALDRMTARFKQGLSVIDLPAFIEDELYVDHTHPVLEGQMRIAEQVAACLKQWKITGSSRATIHNRLYNPEHALGNHSEFYSYFRTYVPLSEEAIKEKMNQLKNAASFKEEEAGDEFRKAFEYYLRHPCFSSIQEILECGPQYPSDVGRFPEFFLVRYVIPYLRIHESEENLKNRFSSSLKVLRTADDLLKILPPPVVSWVSSGDPIIHPERERVRLLKILSRVELSLVAHLRQGNQIYNRLKTTIYWYFRETLRYGSHSRFSMRYDRTLLEFAAESLAVAGVIDQKMGGEKSREIEQMIAFVEEITKIHETFCAQFSLKKNDPVLLKEYDRQLLELAEKIEQPQGAEGVHLRNIGLLSR